MRRPLRWPYRPIGFCLATVCMMGLGPVSAGAQVVGHVGDTVHTPVNQLLTPVGQQIQLPGMRPQAIA
ncbi:MAG: hypothetical protein KDA45_14795, partial [Planctomycetales bacterium]|nr:hypothetical protein [Planctomycetales bacterium]